MAAAAKAITEFAKENDKLEVKGGMMDGAFTTVLARVLAKADGELDLGEHIVDPADGKCFFKVRIEED